jgi:hypothetical protein
MNSSADMSNSNSFGSMGVNHHANGGGLTPAQLNNLIGTAGILSASYNHANKFNNLNLNAALSLNGLNSSYANSTLFYSDENNSPNSNENSEHSFMSGQNESHINVGGVQSDGEDSTHQLNGNSRKAKPLNVDDEIVASRLQSTQHKYFGLNRNIPCKALADENQLIVEQSQETNGDGESANQSNDYDNEHVESLSKKACVRVGSELGKNSSTTSLDSKQNETRSPEQIAD